MLDELKHSLMIELQLRGEFRSDLLQLGVGFCLCTLGFFETFSEVEVGIGDKTVFNHLVEAIDPFASLEGLLLSNRKPTLQIGLRGFLTSHQLT